MIKIEKTEVVGWEAAIRGMRNPLESWDKSDTSFWCYPEEGVTHKIGPNDLSLMKKLAKAGSDHRKFLRMITVYADITAPLYWWKEFDTYKVGTVANSCSTMHTIHKKEFTLDDFSHEKLVGYTGGGVEITSVTVLNTVITWLNVCREQYNNTKNKWCWEQIIQLLPTSYNQKRTVMLNYEVLLNMYRARKAHKLDEWHALCDWVERLPYFKEICLGGDDL